MVRRKSELKFRVINPNAEEVLVAKLIEIIVQNTKWEEKHGEMFKNLANGN